MSTIGRRRALNFFFCTPHAVLEYLRRTAEQSASEEWMNLTNAADLLGISARTLRLAVERGEVQAQHPFPEGPWVFNRSELETPAARALVQRVSGRNGHPTLPIGGQTNFEFSMT